MRLAPLAVSHRAALWLVLPLAAATLPGCSDQKVGAYNSPPTAAILTPEDDDALIEGATVTLRGSASDPNDDATSLLASWYADDAPACAEAAPSADGTTECAFVVPDRLSTLRLEVRDPDGAADSATIDVSVTATAPPVATIVSPTPADHLYADVPIHFVGTATDAEDGPSLLTIAWSDALDGPLALSGSADSDGVVTDDGYLTAGDHVLMLTVTDTTGKTDTAEVPLHVSPPNTAPTCGILTPGDGSTWREGDAIDLTALVGDADQTADTLGVTWEDSVDGALGSSTPTSSGDVALSVDTLSPGTHTITLRVTDEGDAACTDAVTLRVGSPPTVTIDAPGDGDVYAATASVAFAGTVADGQDPADTLAITWVSDVDGALSSAAADSSGRTTFTTTGLGLGAHAVTLTATDSDGMSGSAVVSFTVDGPPGAPTVALTPDPATSSDTLTATVVGPSADPEGDPVTYRYAWYVDGVVSGASTSASLPASATSRGEVWTVRVTPNDGYQDGASAEASVTVGNGAPSVSGVTLSPASPTAADALTCAWSGYSDPDGDADASTLVWTRGATTLGTAATLSSGYSRGDLVTCTVTPFDGALAGTPVAASVTIADAPPTVGSVSISPSSATTNSTLTASAAGSDADGDAVSFTYDWYVNGTFSRGGSTTLSGSTSFDKGDTVYVVATPSDGITTGTPRTSSTLTVANSLPGAAVVAIAPSTPAEGVDDLVCYVATPATDADGDAITYAMTWTVDGVPWTGATFASSWSGDTVDGANTIGGETWTCTATPSDGSGTGTTATATVSITSTSVDYTDTWSLGSTVSYRCAGGAVDFTFSQLSVYDSYPDITVVGSGNVAAMAGTFSSATDFSASNTLRGTCTETYAITGTFVDANTFTGTLTASYSGAGRSCADCTNHSWSVTGTR